MTRRCGVVGTGALGRGFVTSLVRAGYVVNTYDIDPASSAWADKAGARACVSARALAGAADVVLLALPDTPQIEDVLDGDAGLAAGLRPGTSLIVASTVDPRTSLRLAERLEHLGVVVLEAPVSGGPARAHAGTLTIMVGGDAGAVEGCRPVLEAIGEHVIHVGPLGHGSITKLVNNLMGAVIALGVAEGLAVAARADLDLERALAAIRHGSGSSWILQEWIPETVLRGDYAPRFSVDLMRKDLDLILRFAESLDVRVPAARLARATFEELAADGLGGYDFSIVAAGRAEAATTTLGAPRDESRA